MRQSAFYGKILFFILLTVFHVRCQSHQQQQKYYLRQQYLKDIERLNQKIVSFEANQQNKVTIKEGSNSTYNIQSNFEFQPETIELKANEFVEFSYLNLSQNLIDIRVKSAPIQQNDILVWPSPQNHFKQSPEHYKLSTNSSSICKVTDPEIEFTRLFYYSHSSLMPEQQRSTHHDVEDIVYLNQQGEYEAIFLNNHQLEVYNFRVMINEHYSKGQILNPSWIHVTNLTNIDTKQKLQTEITGNQKMFLFHYERQRKMLLIGNYLYELIDSANVKKFARLGLQGQTEEQNLNILNQTQSETQNQTDKPKFRQDEVPIKIIPLKFGFLIQYSHYFQMYQLSEQTTQPTPIMLPKLDSQKVHNLLMNKTIVDIEISEQLSHNSGYRIFVLLSDFGIAEFQYGAYSSVNLYEIPYGDRFLDLQIHSEDILQITFEIDNSKKVAYHLMQIFIEREVNPRKPTVYINRYYNDLKDISKSSFLKSQQLLIVGQSELLIYDYPINSKVLLKENITQFPYHFSIERLQKVHVLQRYSSNQSIQYMFIVAKNQLILARMEKKEQAIQCSSEHSFDTRIQMLKYCDDRRLQSNLCRYVGNLRIIVKDEEGARLRSIKQYLIALLIFCVLISVCILIRQIAKNTKIISKLKKIKERINGQRQLESKGKKLAGEDKFSELNEENAEVNYQSNTQNLNSQNQQQKNQ